MTAGEGLVGATDGWDEARLAGTPEDAAAPVFEERERRHGVLEQRGTDEGTGSPERRSPPPTLMPLACGEGERKKSKTKSHRQVAQAEEESVTLMPRAGVALNSLRAVRHCRRRLNRKRFV